MMHLSTLVKDFIQKDQEEYFIETLFDNIGYSVNQNNDGMFVTTYGELKEHLTDSFSKIELNEIGVTKMIELLNCSMDYELINIGK